jgi:hypothetical protein
MKLDTGATIEFAGRYGETRRLSRGTGKTCSLPFAIRVPEENRGWHLLSILILSAIFNPSHWHVVGDTQ